MTYTLLFLLALSVVSIKTQTIEDEYQEPPSNSTDNASSYDTIVKKFVKQNSIKSGVITSPYLQIRFSDKKIFSKIVFPDTKTSITIGWVIIRTIQMIQ
ncbi:hypothetical protein L5515_008608 [Caenorhabditis briggsae]|uniref:Uncharacterized protein n=1 Tax=Caenorhabditis briggsae TaxID=6238 RepID=A0AAE9F1U0_CAEBR|nr:hypothetical protein L5515_008608 [Caenorhabditis briggsae]